MRMGGLEGASLTYQIKTSASLESEEEKKLPENIIQELENPKIKMQVQPAGHDSVFHLFVITTENRDELMKFLNEKNIFPGLHYPVPCHLQKAYASLGYKNGDFPQC